MKHLGLYLFFAFALAWGICAWLYFSGMYLLYMTVGLAACMFAPAISVVLTKLITKEGWRSLPYRPRFKGHVRYYVLAWLGPILFTVLGVGLYFLFYPGQFSLELWQESPNPWYVIVLTLLFVPIVNIIPTAGEEMGWRGYLLPKLLERHSMKKALLFSGLIWGLWHAPMIAMGHNYGTSYWGYPWVGILAMCVLCVFWGSFLSYVTLKSGSFWPAALGHGFINGTAALGVMFLATDADYNIFVGPLPVGVIGGAAFIVVGLLCFFTLKKPMPAAAVDEG